MEFLIQDFWIYVLLIFVGFVISIINTLAGGASILTLPILIFLGLPANVANGTNRLAIMTTAVFASLGFKSKGIKNSPFNLYLGISALIGSIIGARIAVDIDDGLFKKILSIIILIIITFMVIKPKIINSKSLLIDNINIKGNKLLVNIIFFFLFGIYGGFINAGIGFVIIFFLHLYNQINLVNVNAIKVFVVSIYTAGAILVFYINDLINYEYGICLAVGSAFGGWYSSRLSVKKGEGFVRVFLIIVAILFSIKLWLF